MAEAEAVGAEVVAAAARSMPADLCELLARQILLSPMQPVSRWSVFSVHQAAVK